MILEEIGMRDDTPDDLVHDLFAGALFPEHPLGREVLGSDDVDRGDAARRHRRVPRRALPSPSNIVFAAAGNLTHDEVRRAGRRARARRLDGDRPERADPSRRRAAAGRRAAPRPTEQAHVVLGVRVARRARSRPLRADGREPGARRRHVVAPVPGGPRAARSRVLGVLVPRERSTTRATSRSTRAPRPSACPRRSTVIDGRARPPRRPTGSPTRELAAAKGHLIGSLAMSLETSAEPHAPARARRSSIEGEIPTPRRADRADRRGRRVDDVAPGHRPGVRRRAPHPRGRRPARRTARFSAATFEAGDRSQPRRGWRR